MSVGLLTWCNFVQSLVTTYSKKFERWYWRWRTLRAVAEAGPYSRIIRPELVSGKKGLYLGESVLILQHARIECLPCMGDGEIRIGDGTVINYYFHCAAAQGVTIGKQVLIAGRVYVSDHDHAWPRSDDPASLSHLTASPP